MTGIILHIRNEKIKQRHHDCLYVSRFFALITLLSVMFFIQPASAYLEEVDDGGTKLTSGEINTNLNRLHDQGKISLKRLKQIDEMMAKSPDAGDGSVQNVLEVTQLVAEREDEEVRAAAETARETGKLLASKQELRHKTSSAVVQAIGEIANLNVLDDIAAKELLQQFAQRKRQ